MASLNQLVAEELALPVDPRVTAMAAATAAKYGAASRAVLFYGSCLRQSQLDGLMLDFYLIVSDYRAAYGKAWLAAANRLVPPNVFYFEHDGLAAKYAVLSEGDFLRECSIEARSVSVWARFSQPSRLVWFADGAAREVVLDAVSEAAPTLFTFTRPVMLGDERNEPLAVFKCGFDLTYGAELRAERQARSLSIVDADEARYLAIGSAVIREHPLPKLPKKPKEAYKSGFQEGAVRVQSRRRAERQWRRRQLKGKLLSVVRLAKASATFAGGADYIVWKINRHAGTDIQLKPWQRRWPLLAAITLLPKLLRSGAVR
jgi:hypothetical protein